LKIANGDTLSAELCLESEDLLVLALHLGEQGALLLLEEDVFVGAASFDLFLEEEDLFGLLFHHSSKFNL